MDELLIEPEPTERELGTAPIKPLFARYAAITFAGMLAQMVMVVLEGLIIGNGLGPLGLAAVTVILPLELLNLALGGALGMGTAAAAGQRLGSGDTAGAQKVFNQGFWLAAYLLVALSAGIALFAPRLGSRLPARVTIREQKTRWGSCSRKGNLNFNWKLIRAPQEALDYVVVHELCHLYEFNHSPGFWRMVESVLPDYEQWKRWLAQHGQNL